MADWREIGLVAKVYAYIVEVEGLLELGIYLDEFIKFVYANQSIEITDYFYFSMQ